MENKSQNQDQAQGQAQEYSQGANTTQSQQTQAPVNNVQGEQQTPPPPPTGAPQQVYAPPAGNPAAQQGYPQDAQPYDQYSAASSVQVNMQQAGQQQQGYSPQGSQQFTQQAYPGQPQKKKWSAGKKAVVIVSIVLGCVILASIVGCAVFTFAVSDAVLSESSNDWTSDALEDSAGSSGSASTMESSDSPSHTEWVNDTQWISNDESYIVFNADGSFSWYQDQNDLTDYYYEGTYEFYTGEEALEYITIDLSEYAVTYDDMMDVIDRSDDYSVENFVVLVLNNDKQIIDGENALEKPTVTPCFGFYFEGQQYLDIANMNTGSYWGFTRIDE